MAQARRKAGKPRKNGASHGFGMFVAGVVVGAVGASFAMGMRSDDPESIGRGIAHLVETSRSRFTTEEVESPPPAKTEKVSTEFDFYMVLPEIERIVPDPRPTEASSDPAEAAQAEAAKPAVAADVEPEAASATPGSRFELQAGAFVRQSDADRLKARLALAGLESRIQKVSIEGRGDFFRVRLGPFDETAQLAAADRKLASLGIKALRLKISGG